MSISTKGIRYLAAITAVATVLSLSGMVLAPRAAQAAVPADYGLIEGTAISAAGSNDPDIYIINDWMYKRLFLNPVIFNFYGHIGWDKVKNISSSTRDAFITSGIFQKAGDSKVYAVEVTGEDTGTLHWVNMTGAQAVAEDANFFKKVFTINDNEFNWYSKSSVDYTALSQIPVYTRGGLPTPTPVGTLSASVASDNPAAKTITVNAAGTEFLKVAFSGTGTVNTVVLKRLGAGETNDFSNVYVYDGAKRLTSGKSFSSSAGEVTFINLNVSVSGTKVLTMVADMASTNTAGNVNYMQLKEVGATSTVSGLPVNGNNMTTAGASSGTYTLEKVGTLTDINVGQKGALISEFKLTANTEGGTIKRLTMLQGGSVKPSDITNLKVKTGTSEWAGSITSDGYLVFDLGTGFFIAKGGNATFFVYGDIAGKRTETIINYFENDSDILMVGDQYGNGMAEGTNALDASTEATTQTLQGGVLTLTYVGPEVANIGTTTSDTALLRYSMAAATNIEVRKTRFVICIDDGGEGTYDAAFTTTASAPDIEDFKVINETTGAIVMGPQDGSAFTTTDSNTCPSSVNGISKQFTDSFDLAAGSVTTFKVTADIKTANTGGLLGADDKMKVALNAYTSDTPDVAVMKYSGSTTAVQDADIVPAADIMGPELTITAPSLTLGLAATPGSQTFIKGTSNVDVVGLTFAAAQASNLTVNEITLSGLANEGAGAAVEAAGFDLGLDATSTAVSVANAITNVRLIEAESGATIANAANVAGGGNQLNTTTGTLKFSGFTWNIPAGATRTALVRVDLSNNTASGTEGDFFSFDISATSDVVALDSSSNTVNAAAASVDPNGAGTPNKYLTIKNNGSITIAQAPSSPVKSAVYWGQTGVPVSAFRFTSTNEAQYMEKLTIIASAANEAVDAKANVKKVKLTYKNKAGATLTAEQSFTNSASANFGWTYSGSGTDTRPYIPKDSSLDIAVAADLRTSTEGATQDTAKRDVNGGNVAGQTLANVGLYVGSSFSLDFSDTYSGSTANGFKLVGEGSGAVIDGANSAVADVLGKNNMIVYRVYPKFDLVAQAAPYTFIGTPDVLKFTITAMGLTDSKLFFDNQNANGGSGSIKFEVVASGNIIEGDYSEGTSSTAFTVYDEDNVTIDSGTLTDDYKPSPHASLTVDFTSQDVEITGGQSKTFRIQITNPNTNFALTSNTGRAADYFQLVLRDDQDGLIRWVGNSTSSTADSNSVSQTTYLKNLPISGPTWQR